jgi:leader peptidase (prepilin peptidase)/N-methyltransferase
MGMGDVKLMAMLGIFLGEWPHIAVILLTASILGSLVGIVLILARGKKLGSAIPFGPFLSIGGLLTLLCGDIIWSWYMRMTGL